MKVNENNKPILIFDWDGTIVDSNQFKFIDAWLSVFEGEEDKKEKFLEIWRNGGGSLYRYALVAKVIAETESDQSDLKSVTNTDQWIRTDSRITKYTDRYSEILKDLGKMPIFENSKQALGSLKEKGHTMYVISGSAEDSIRKQIDFYGLDFFKGIFGNTDSKPNHFKTISKLEDNSDPENYIVIGDGELDLALAQHIGCRFVGIPNEWNGWAKGYLLEDVKGDAQLGAHRVAHGSVQGDIEFETINDIRDLVGIIG